MYLIFPYIIVKECITQEALTAHLVNSVIRITNESGHGDRRNYARIHSKQNI